MNDQHRENLRNAAVALRERADEIRPHFNMRIFVDKPVTIGLGPRQMVGPWEALSIIANNYSCGAQGCLIGLTPWLIGETPNQSDRSWFDYCQRVYGVESTPGGNQSHHDYYTWSWLFSSDWTKVDNTPEGAAARIEHFLEHGVPDDWFAQMSGTVPLCYESDQQRIRWHLKLALRESVGGVAERSIMNALNLMDRFDPPGATDAG